MPYYGIDGLAEDERFELSRDLHPLSVFKTDPFNRLGNLPWLVDPAGLEPAASRL